MKKIDTGIPGEVQWIDLDTPDQTQEISLALIEPHEQNNRLFIELESLDELVKKYKRCLEDPALPLPNAPVLRYIDENTKLKLLAGERRVRAATIARYESLPCRVVELDDQGAFEFLLEDNHQADITTVELAYTAAEMSRMGFPEEDIGRLLGGVSPSRYVGVGQYIHPEMFTDLPKLCNPSITVWGEAAVYGPEHFQYCFRNWDAGIWDEEQCRKNFRRRGVSPPLDNTEKGIRMSTTADGRRLIVRGTLDLDLYTPEELERVAELFIRDFKYTVRNGVSNHEDEGFGLRVITNYNPVSIEELE
jgi:hypothetical protein